MNVCMYVCMYVGIYVFIMYVCMFVCMYVCMYACMLGFLYVCKCLYVKFGNKSGQVCGLHADAPAIGTGGKNVRCYHLTCTRFRMLAAASISVLNNLMRIFF